MRISKKILSIVLSLLMAFSMMPFTAFAGTSYSGYVVADGDNGEDLWNKEVYFNDYTWYIIEDNSTSANAGTVTLFCKDKIGESKFSVDATNNHYSTSTVRTYLDNQTATGSFADVADAIVTIDSLTTNGFQSSEVYDTAENVKLYLLDKTEAENLPFRVRRSANNDVSWWVRSPGGVDPDFPNDPSHAMYVDITGEFSADIGDYVTATWKVRPALKLDLSKVVFDSSSKTFELAPPAPAVPQATVTEVAAPEGAAFAYKFEAPADKPTAYDAYHADFVATFDRNIKAGEVTLYGKYGDYGWVSLTINEDIPAGTPYRIYQNLMNDTLTYATVRDEVSPFYCGAGGAVLNEANMTVQLKLYPVEGGVEGTPVDASETVTDTIEAIPMATVTEVTAPEGAAFAYKFEADSAKPTAYDNYHADFVATFDRDIKAGEVTLYGKYGEYGWVELTINEDIPAGTPYRIYKNLMNDTLTYATVRDEVSPFYCGAGGAVLADTNMTVNFVLYPVEGGTEGTPVEASEDVTGEIEKPAAPQATVTEVTAPEGAAFAYKFEAPADKPTAYDAYHADFVATFDRNIKAGEVTLYGKYGEYGWVALTINEDIPAGTPYRIYQNLMNDTLTYATVRDEVSPFYCGAGGAVLNEANMTVQLKLYPVEGGVEGTPVDASETVTDTIEAIPMATVTEVTAPEGAAFAYKFEADSAKPTAYDSYHADFVATFDRDIKAGEVTLYGKYGEYGWVELTINEDIPAGTPYRIYKNLMNDTLTYATVRDEVSPFYCGAGGAVLADTNMTVNFVLYPVEGGTEGTPVEASEDVTGEIEKPAAPVVEDKYSITINDKVELNVLIEETDVTKLGVKYNKTPDEENDGTPDEAEIISVSSLTKQGNYYVVNVPLAPAQIRDVITIDVYKGDNLDRTISTSVANYCEAIVNNHAYTGDNAALVEALAQATLDYGKAASDYFGYNTDAYAGYTISNNTLPSLSGLVANDTTGLITGVRYVAKSVPELRFETSLTEAEFFDDEGNALYSVSCVEGYAAKFAKVGNTVVIEVKGIPASKLGEAIHLNVSGKVNGAIEYTPLAFSSVASRSSDNNLKALGIAIANYGVAAANLF